MRTVKALYDGNEVRIIEPVKLKKNTEIFLVIPNDMQKISPSEARKQLRGSGKGEKLTEKLLKSRKEDSGFDR